MDVSTILKIFTDHGKYVGFSVIGAWFMWYYRKNICKVARRTVRKWLGINSSKTQEEEDVLEKKCYDRSIDIVINRTLDTLLAQTGACRAWIFEFQRYDERIKPIPYRTQSNTYERIAQGRNVKYESDKLQDMPLSAYPAWTRWLAKDYELILETIDDVKDEDMEMWKTLSSQGIQSMFAVILLDYRETPIGVAGVDFTESGLGILKEEDARQWFFAKVVTLAGLITYKNNGTLSEDR